MKATTLLALVLAIVAVTHPQVAAAASFPTRQVRIVVPYPPGGGVDSLARALAEGLSKAWNQTVAPVTQLIDLHQMVVVHPSVEANTMQSLANLAKKSPENFSYGSYGKGSQPNLLFETFKAKTGAQILHVPFRGIAPAVIATLSNEVQMTLGSAATTGQYTNIGRMKALAIVRKERLAAFPNVPTLAEAGFGDADPQSWFGLFAPAVHLQIS